MSKISDLKVMDEMAHRSLDIRAFPDIVNMQSVKKGGHVTIGTDKGTIQQLMHSSTTNDGKYKALLFVVNMDQYKKLKTEMEHEEEDFEEVDFEEVDFEDITNNAGALE